MNQRLGSLALAVGAVLGLVLGLVYAWLVEPVELYDTTPDLLRSDYRHEWIRLAALGYVTDGDLARAQTRLETLSHEDVQTALAALINSYTTQGRPAETMRALSGLADQLGVYTPAMEVYLGTSSSSSSPSPNPSPSPTAIPSATTPTPTPIIFAIPTASPSPAFVSSLYRVISQTLVCEGTVPQLQVLVRAAPRIDEGEEVEEEVAEETIEEMPLAGVVLWLTWPGGADRAVTGLRPQIDPGYADFTLLPDVPYALSIGEPNAPVLSGLTVQLCPTMGGGEPQPGSWRVVVEAAGRE